MDLLKEKGVKIIVKKMPINESNKVGKQKQLGV